MKRILIVDEDEHVRYSFRRILEAYYEIVECRSGKEALVRLEENTPDLVVVDVRTAKRGDLDTCEKIRELDPELPIIVMSSYGIEEAKRIVQESGAYGFVLKPFDIEELRKLVSEAVAHRST